MNGRMFFRELPQRGWEQLISRRRLREIKRLGGGSLLLIQKRNVMPLPSRINSDPNRHDSQWHRETDRRHDNLPVENRNRRETRTDRLS